MLKLYKEARLDLIPQRYLREMIQRKRVSDGVHCVAENNDIGDETLSKYSTTYNPDYSAKVRNVRYGA